jgi:hypothetical protein
MSLPCTWAPWVPAELPDQGTPLKMLAHFGLIGQLQRRLSRANLSLRWPVLSAVSISHQMTLLLPSPMGVQMRAVTAGLTGCTQQLSLEQQPTPLHLGPLISATRAAPEAIHD